MPRKIDYADKLNAITNAYKYGIITKNEAMAAKAKLDAEQKAPIKSMTMTIEVVHLCEFTDDEQDTLFRWTSESIAWGGVTLPLIDIENVRILLEYAAARGDDKAAALHTRLARLDDNTYLNLNAAWADARLVYHQIS